jgi:FkbM family methyltransferase
MNSVSEKLGWRARMLAEKASGKIPNVPWPLMWQWVSQRHDEMPKPGVTVLEEDPAADMVLLGIGKHQFWFPAAADRDLLDVFYPEVFDSRHPHFYEYAGARLREGDVALDAGACEGFFIRYALERGAKVLAIEPWSLMANCLERTFAPEVADGRVQVVRTFLGKEAGETEFTVNLDHPFASGPENDKSNPRSVTERVPITTLDDVVEGSQFSRIDFLKMDIEGSEMSALSGAARTFEKFVPRVSITTYHRATDWLDIPAQVCRFNPSYQFTHKGVVFYPGGWRPMLCHGWV